MAVKYPAHDPELPVVAVDFDGVLVENTWPVYGIGRANNDALALLRHYHEEGCEVVIFTARPESHFGMIRGWLFNHGIGHAVYDVTNIKPRASVYIDDRAHRWPLGGDTELAWAAGFYDGEGCTSLLKKNKNVSVRASCAQKDVRLLERFHAAVGGLGKIGPPQKSGVSNWFSNSHPIAKEVLDLLWPYLGPAKREQAERCFAQSTWHGGGKCLNPKHHMVADKKGHRRCKECRDEYQKKYNAERKLCG